jgi:asparaginyl-tRNA synthetase
VICWPRLGEDHEGENVELRAHLTSEQTRATLRLQQAILAAVRTCLAERGFTEVMLPIVGPVTDPGNRGAKQVDIDYYGHRYKLMTSAILYKQATLLTFDRIFCVAPNVRIEPVETAGTGRHLAEFHQIDVEIAGATREDAMLVAEEVVARAAAAVLDARSILTAVADGEFDRLSYGDAVAELRALGTRQDDGAEINWQAEKVLSDRYKKPFFLVGYPKGSRGFYDREDPDEPGRLRNFDLLAGEGYGELASGGERESDYARVVTRMRETGENPAKYAWYLDLVREGVPASAGFGIGLERLTRYLLGLPEVTRACAFPKRPGVASP